jgi:hypothetical protein
VSDYGLDDRAIGVLSPAGAKDFSSSLCVQTGSGAHPASCKMGTGVLSPGVKRGRGVMMTTHPHLVPRSWMSRSYTSSPPKLTLLFYFYKSSPAFSVPGDKPEITPAVLPTFVQFSSSPWIPWPIPSSCTLWIPLQSCLARFTAS